MSCQRGDSRLRVQVRYVNWQNFRPHAPQELLRPYLNLLSAPSIRSLNRFRRKSMARWPVFVMRRLRKSLKSCELLKALSGYFNTSSGSKSHSNSSTHEKFLAIQQALSTILDNDQDLCLLHLSKFYRDPELFEDISTIDHDDAEVRISRPPK